MVKKGVSTRASKLYKSLEKRLEILTNNLLDADITEKSIDLVKEIKELHTLLRAVKGEEIVNANPVDAKVVLAWEDNKSETGLNNNSENVEHEYKS